MRKAAIHPFVDDSRFALLFNLFFNDFFHFLDTFLPLFRSEVFRIIGGVVYRSGYSVTPITKLVFCRPAIGGNVFVCNGYISVNYIIHT